MSFVSTWAGFAAVWWIIAYSHGDFEYIQRLQQSSSSSDSNNNSSNSDILNDTFIPCVTEIKSFATAFLFSVETQHTIGKFSFLFYKIYLKGFIEFFLFLIL